MNIYYDTLEELADIVYELVRKGLKFNVRTAINTIELTGGY